MRIPQLDTICSKIVECFIQEKLSRFREKNRFDMGKKKRWSSVINQMTIFFLNKLLFNNNN